MKLLAILLIGLPCYAQIPFDWNGVLFQGQSYSEGRAGNPALSDAAVGFNGDTAHNLQLTLTNGHYATVAPLRNMLEDSSPDGLAGPIVETPATAMVNNLTQFAGTLYPVFIASRNSLGGTAYAGLKKGQVQYAIAMAATTGQIAVEKAEAVTAGKSFGCLFQILMHGASDFINGMSATTYEADLVEWNTDTTVDCKTRTSQTSNVYTIISQDNLWTFYSRTQPMTTAGGSVESTPIAQWQVMIDHPQTHCLAGPVYQMAFNAANMPHLTNVGYRALGETFAKRAWQYLSTGRCYPLTPRTITNVDSTNIDIRFWVPAGSLAFDTTTVPNQGNCKGFEYVDDSGRTCSSVAIQSSDTIRLTSSGTTGANGRVRYAYTGTSGIWPGAAGAARGNLRDDDTATALSGATLYDWAVTFNVAVGFSWSPALMYFPGVK